MFSHTTSVCHTHVLFRNKLMTLRYQEDYIFPANAFRKFTDLDRVGSYFLLDFFFPDANKNVFEKAVKAKYILREKL